MHERHELIQLVIGNRKWQEISTYDTLSDRFCGGMAFSFFPPLFLLASCDMHSCASLLRLCFKQTGLLRSICMSGGAAALLHLAAWCWWSKGVEFNEWMQKV